MFGGGETEAVKVKAVKIAVVESQLSFEARNRNDANPTGRNKDKTKKNGLAVVVYTVNHSTRKAEAGSRWEFQASLVYIVRP